MDFKQFNYEMQLIQNLEIRPYISLTTLEIPCFKTNSSDVLGYTVSDLILFLIPC